MIILTAKNFSIDSDNISKDNLLFMFAEAWTPGAHISLDTADGSKSVFWKARAMEVDYGKKEATILVDVIWGKYLLRIYYEDGVYRTSLRDTVDIPVCLDDFENSHFCFKGKYTVQIEF